MKSETIQKLKRHMIFGEGELAEYLCRISTCTCSCGSKWPTKIRHMRSDVLCSCCDLAQCKVHGVKRLHRQGL